MRHYIWDIVGPTCELQAHFVLLNLFGSRCSYCLAKVAKLDELFLALQLIALGTSGRGN